MNIKPPSSAESHAPAIEAHNYGEEVYLFDQNSTVAERVKLVYCLKSEQNPQAVNFEEELADFLSSAMSKVDLTKDPKELFEHSFVNASLELSGVDYKNNPHSKEVLVELADFITYFAELDEVEARHLDDLFLRLVIDAGLAKQGDNKDFNLVQAVFS